MQEINTQEMVGPQLPLSPLEQFEKIKFFSFKGKYGVFSNIVTFAIWIGGIVAMFFIFDCRFG